LGTVEELGGCLLEVGGAFFEVEFATFKEEVGVSLDEAGHEGRVRGGDVGGGLAGVELLGGRSFTLGADEMDMISIVDDVGVAGGGFTVEERADVEPDAAGGGGGGNGNRSGLDHEEGGFCLTTSMSGVNGVTGTPLASSRRAGLWAERQ